MRAVWIVCAMALAATTAAGQEAPPAGGIVIEAPDFALAVGRAGLDWDTDAPFDDAGLWTLALERRLGPVVRGRAMLAWGSSDLALETPVDTRLYLIDLQALIGPDLGPITIYAIGGVGAFVTAPDEPPDVDLPTRSQSQVTYGGGVRARMTRHFEAGVEFTSAALRLADPVDAQVRETDTIHNSRWEGRVSWLF